VGQAFFLFMGFELLTSHAEVASKSAIGRALIGSVLVLTLFYAIISLGFTCLEQLPTPTDRSFFIPQIAIAEQAGGTKMIILVTFISILASFTTFNGALLALSRFIYALAAQGILPRPLAQLEPRTLTARNALLALLGSSILFTLLLHLLAWYEATILAAAIAATLVYATATWTRECSPFRETGRSIGWRILNGMFATILTLIALNVILYAGQARSNTLTLLALVYSIAIITVIIQRYKKNRQKSG
jgi:amino acid transporter